MSALLPILLPLVLLAMMSMRPAPRRLAMTIAPWSALILLWPFFDSSTISLRWPFMVMTLGPDEISRPILLLTSLAWTMAGWFAASGPTRTSVWFWCGWLGSLVGMSLLLLAGDLASFYIGYATLSLSAYLLITHARSAEAWRAGRIYLIMAMLGEAAILAGVMIIAGQVGNIELRELAEQPAILLEGPARWLLLTGFAVKMGIVPLHLWLPLAHPAAPVPASAILSGIIVKAGLMGWLRLVPSSALDLDLIGLALLALGLITAFAGAILGLLQQRLKTVLAYSTISQTGLLLCAFALLFVAPEQTDTLLPVIGLLALHHGLNKATLFLACGCAPGRSPWRLLLVALPAISLAAAPLTTGFLAKGALKSGAEQALLAGPWLGLLAASSAATALIMWRVWYLARQLDEPARPAHPAWILLTLLALTLPWIWAVEQSLLSAPDPAKLWAATWPILLAGALILIKQRLAPAWHPGVPEGDLVVWLERIKLPRRVLLAPSTRTARPNATIKKITGFLHDWEREQRQLPAAGLAILIIGGIVWLLLIV